MDLKLKFLLYILLPIICFACSEKQIIGNKPLRSANEGRVGVDNNPSGLEDFESFFKKFQQDSLFRIERTIFPLNGYNSDDDELTGDDVEDNAPTVYFWERNIWQEYAKITYSESDLKKSIIKTDTLIKHTIYKENSGFEVYSEFKLIDNKWFLSYYSYQNI
jgi:hypothetical protein